MKYYIGIDLGGTFVKAGVVDENYNIIAKASVDSADVAGDAEKVADRMAECARQALANANLTMDDVRRRYSPQIASRLEGEYRVLPFFGQDVRIQRKQRF